MAAQDYYGVVQQLYVAYFGRPADHYGLENYAAALDALKAPTDFTELNAAVQADAAGTSGLAQLVHSFDGSAEAAGLYGNVTDQQSAAKFVLAIYQNLLGREPDNEGFNFWVNAITTGGLAKSNAAAAIAQGALTNTTELGLKDAATVNNKVAVATAFTESLDTPLEWTAFSGPDAAMAARNLVTAVNSTTDVTAYQTQIDAAISNLSNQNTVGKSFDLTKGIDSGATFTGTTGNDTYNAVIDNTTGAVTTTLTPLDALNGGTGTDTLNLNILNGAGAGVTAVGSLPSVTATSIETLNIRAAVDFTGDVSAWTDLTNVNVTQGQGVTLTASGTAAINIAGTTGTVTANGGASQSISVENADVFSGSVGIASHDSKGDVAITVSKVGAHDVVVTGGANVTVATTGATSGNTINIGQGTQQPTGAVNVSVTGAAYDKAGSSVAFGAITVKGGTSVTVNEVAYASTANAAADAGVGAVTTQTQGAVNIDGAGTATTVTVNQTKAVTVIDAVTAIAGVKEAASYTVGALLTGQTLTIGGLSFKATQDLTAAQAAAAFADLSAGAFQGHAPVANGTYTGTFSGSWTTAAANGTTLTIIAKDASNTQLGAPSLSGAVTGSGTQTPPTATGTNVLGVTNVNAVTGVAGVANGIVTITDSGTTDKIASVTLNGYADTSAITSDALTTLSLANSAASLTVTNTKQTTLDLTVDALASGASVGTQTYTSVNLHVASNSTFTLADTAVKALVVDGSGTANISGSSQFGALESVVVNGSAGLNIGGASTSTTLKSIDTTNTTGTVTAMIDASKATYTGGAGSDNVTLSSTTVSKAISTGAGNDTVTLSSGTSTSSIIIDGGDGTDTLGLTADDAGGASTTTAFATKFVNFEKLSLSSVQTGTTTVNLANMNNINYVVSSNGAQGTATAEVQTFTVSGTTAATGEQQTFKISGGAGSAGNLTIAGATVALAGTETVDQIGLAIDNATGFAGSVSDVSYDSITKTVTISYNPSAGNVGAATVLSGGTGATFGGVADNAVAYNAHTGNVVVDGATIALAAGLTQDQVGAAIVAAQASIKAADANVDTVSYNSGTHEVSITYFGTAGNVGNATLSADLATGETFGTVTQVTQGASAVSSSGNLVLTNFANNGTIELTAAGAGATISLKDATGTSDSFNIVTTLTTTNANVGTVSVAGVETLNVNVNDTDTSNSTGGGLNSATLNVKDAAVKSLVITSNANLTLTQDAGNVALVSIDGSAATGKLALSSVSGASAAATITGGSGNDILTANHANDVLVGGAGNDTLVVHGNLVTLTGGAGADTFSVGFATTNVNGYATISDLTAGDTLQFLNTSATESFASAKVALGATAVFQDFANSAVAGSTAGTISWFQYGGDTYVVENVAHGSTFTNGQDVIVKITGAIDLGTASFSADHQTLLIG